MFMSRMFRPWDACRSLQLYYEIVCIRLEIKSCRILLRTYVPKCDMI